MTAGPRRLRHGHHAATGCAVAAAVGTYDASRIAEAGWIGLPAGSWPGLDLGFGRAFWILLPAFLFVSMAEALKTVVDGIATQMVSWRKPRAVDFCAVQGAINANGVGTLLPGLGVAKGGGGPERRYRGRRRLPDGRHWTTPHPDGKVGCMTASQGRMK